jgi:hypothetical protein
MKPAAAIASLFLALVALLHLVRALTGAAVSVGSTAVPVWMSVAACVFAGGLAVMLWRESRR